MVEITIDYLGELRCRARHGPSRQELHTDAPVDNQGKGESFSPTDLVATALGSCMATIMGITARQLGLSLTGMTMRVTKEMSTDAPRRIARLTVRMQMPAGLAPRHRDALRQAAEGCPVKASLDPRIEIPLEIIYPD